jgi:hypothetical protein
MLTSLSQDARDIPRPSGPAAGNAAQSVPDMDTAAAAEDAEVNE